MTQEQIEAARQLRAVKEKRENGLREIDKLKDKIAKLKEQHKLELLNSSHLGDSPLDTTISMIDGHRVSTEAHRPEEAADWPCFLLE